MKSLKKTVSIILLCVCFASNIYPAFAADTEEYFAEAVDAKEYFDDATAAEEHSSDTTNAEEYFDDTEDIEEYSAEAVGISETYSSGIHGGNLVLNGSFESGTTNWTNWEGNCASASETFHSGSKSVKLWAKTSGQYEQFLQNVKVKPGTSYDFNSWVRVPSGQTVEVALVLSGSGYPDTTVLTKRITYSESLRDPAFRPNKVDGSAGDGHTLWQSMGGTVNIPNSFPNYVEGNESTYPTLCIYFRYTSGGNWNRYLYIDDVSIERVYGKNEFVKSVKFYQNGKELSGTGFSQGVVIVNVNIDDVTIYDHSPYVIIAAYDGDELLAFNTATVTHTPNSNGTVDLSTEINVTADMISSGCKISAFIWSDIDSMVSMTNTYSIDSK